MSVKDIHEIIEDRIQYMKNRSKEFMNEFNLQDYTIIHGGLQNIKSLKPYKLTDPGAKKQKLENWKINSFKSIGWSDPFPNGIQTGKFIDSKKAKKELIDAFKEEAKARNVKELS